MMPSSTQSRNGTSSSGRPSWLRKIWLGSGSQNDAKMSTFPSAANESTSVSREVPDDRFEPGDLLGGEQRVEQPPAHGVLLPVEHQRDQRPARTQRERHDERGVGVHGVDVSALGDRHDLVVALQLHRVVASGDRPPRWTAATRS
jgi:hypothetical protein